MTNVKLESFESDPELAEKADAGFAQGFVEGHAAGLAEAQATQTTLAHEFVQSVADLEFKYEEARSEITHAMGPLLSALANKVFPQCIADGFAEQIVALLLNAAAEHGGRRFALRVHPQHSDAVTAALATAAIDAHVVNAPTLQPHAAWIQHEAGALQVDCDQLLNDIKAILSSVDVIQPRSETHG